MYPILQNLPNLPQRLWLVTQQPQVFLLPTPMSLEWLRPTFTKCLYSVHWAKHVLTKTEKYSATFLFFSKVNI